MSDAPDTLSRRKTLRFWGWGYEDEDLSTAERDLVRNHAGRYSADGLVETAAPTIDEFDLPAPRATAPASLEPIISTTPYDRLVHAHGKSYPDGVRMLMREVPNAPDMVAFPRDEQAISDVLDWASGANVAVIPYGGGTSVCSGVEAAVGGSYDATLSLDLQYFDKVLEIDRTSRAARIQAGANGPELEAQLKPHGLTLRFFPQSFELSTLGGWIATRAGGHYASLYTHIDDLVESTRTVTPRGLMESRRLPGSGAGPSHDRMMLGSEGTLGVITEAWMRLQDRPTFRASASVTFATMDKAVGAVRALSQSGLYPTNCRLLDETEVAFNSLGEGPLVVLGFESADHPLDAWMARALELVADYGGSYDSDAVARSMARSMAPREDSKGDAEHLKGAAGAWRNAFIRMPYYRNLTMAMGLIGDTFETATTWDNFERLYLGAKEQVGDVITRVTGQPARVSCRFTHIYPDGPAPYFTFATLGTATGDLHEALSKWREIKAACNDAIVGLGGTVTHHHAVGRDHRSGYEAQSAPLFRETLAAAKQSLDPQGILNPGVLIDPKGRDVGITGAMG